jgi:hypothetical protein
LLHLLLLLLLLPKEATASICSNVIGCIACHVCTVFCGSLLVTLLAIPLFLIRLVHIVILQQYITGSCVSDQQVMLLVLAVVASQMASFPYPSLS